MGFNSVVVVLNDCLSEIEKDPKFGKKVGDAISSNHMRQKPVDIDSGYCVNAATVVSCEHANVTQLIAVGGNCATVLAYLWGDHHTEEGQLNLLKNWADSMGYNVIKKRNKK